MPRFRLSGLRVRIPRLADAEAVARALSIPEDLVSNLAIVRRSLDARQKPNLVWEIAVEFDYAGEAIAPPAPPLRLEAGDPPRSAPELLLPRLDRSARVVVVGSGPAGLFAALALVDAGVEVTLLERGDPAEDRYRKVMRFWTAGEFDPESNVQFGEGGAGTFSDGKLTCGKRHAKIAVVLDVFLRFGAPETIRYDAKPHIGTDRLVRVLRNIRKHLVENGALIRYRSRVADLRIGPDGSLAALVLDSGEEVPATVAVLALGHSARDTMDVLLARGVAMTRKPFAMGVRIEHPQGLIDTIQYGRLSQECGVAPADYKQTAVTRNGRGVYTFCMCPGGEVIACSSEPEQIVTNGMSRYKRASGFANAGLVVQTRDEDFAGMPGPELLAGRELQRKVERAAFLLAGGTYAAPAMRVTDFLAGREPRGLPKATYGPSVVPRPLKTLFPPAYLESLADGLRAFDQRMRGFVSEEAVLVAPETRTSSPVRIERDPYCESPTVRGLYPAGEGAGFAGGIVSAALDGLRVARAVRARLAGETIEPEVAPTFKGPEY